MLRGLGFHCGCTKTSMRETYVFEYTMNLLNLLNTPIAADSSFSSSPPPAPQPNFAAQIVRSGRLPHPQIGIIAEIERAIRIFSRTPTTKERICEFIQNQSYIKSMIEVFNVAEDIENLETLHALCTCMHTIRKLQALFILPNLLTCINILVQLNDHSIYEHVLQDELWLSVVGMMECTHRRYHFSSRWNRQGPIANAFFSHHFIR